MNYPKNPELYCIDDFQLKYTPFSKIREEKVTGIIITKFDMVWLESWPVSAPQAPPCLPAVGR